MVALTYLQGQVQPTNLSIDTKNSLNTGYVSSEDELVEIVLKNWDLRLGAAAKSLRMKRPIYKKLTISQAHFGILDCFDATWEVIRDLSHEHVP